MLVSAAAGVEEAADGVEGGDAAGEDVGEGCGAGEEGVGIGQLHPAVGQFLAVEDVQCFEDADEVGDTKKAVGFKGFADFLLKLIVAAIGDAAEEFASVFIADLPVFDDFEEGASGGRREAATLFQAVEIGQFGRGEARLRIYSYRVTPGLSHR